MPVIQEKNQATLDGSGDGKNTWASASGARVSHPQTSLEMPPGYDIEGDGLKAVAGSDDPMDTSEKLMSGVAEGFRKTNEGVIEDETNSPFYDDAGGFAERWSVLDRSG